MQSVGLACKNIVLKVSTTTLKSEVMMRIEGTISFYILTLSLAGLAIYFVGLNLSLFVTGKFSN